MVRERYDAVVVGGELSVSFDRFATRQAGPARMMATTLPRSLYVNARQALARG